jgi:hypothetical protein
MSYIDWKKLKERVSLRDILDHYDVIEGLKETPQGFEGTCPVCGSHAFKANREKNAWFCFGECKTKAKETEGHNGGNILDFVSRMEGVSVKKAGELISAWFPEDKAMQPKKEPEKDGRTQRTKAETARHEPKEPVPPSPTATQEEQPKEPAKPESEGQGEEVRGTSSRPSATPVERNVPESIPGKTNRPLPFTLKSVDDDHPECDRLGFERETLKHFKVGYFTGKGMMHGKVVFPFYNKEGLLVAYIGYSMKDGSLTYPEAFDRRVELYNYPLCEYGLDAERDSVVLVTDLLNVLRLYEFGVRNVLALPTEDIHEPQLDLIESIVGLGGQVDFVPWSKEYGENLRRLATRFYTRLHRYYLGSEDEFLRQVVATIDS